LVAPENVRANVWLQLKNPERKIPERPASPDERPTFPAQSVDMLLIIDFRLLSFRQDLTAAEHFQRGLVHDLSTVTDLNPLSFHIKKMSLGTGLVEIDILDSSIWGGGMQHIAAELVKQSKDEASPLRTGTVTSAMKSIFFPSLCPSTTDVENFWDDEFWSDNRRASIPKLAFEKLQPTTMTSSSGKHKGIPRATYGGVEMNKCSQMHMKKH
jgi:hypothetical protein